MVDAIYWRVREEEYRELALEDAVRGLRLPKAVRSRTGRL
jgi:hypothetical protein